ncbi:MAG: hypothetical protein ABIN97_04020 [Ginsengibacter sp.]
MSVAEMKKAINEKMDKLNEEQLKVIFEIIEKTDDKQKSKFNAEKFFEEISERYGNVLQKLAQ